MANQTVNIPVGKSSVVTIKVTDAASNDISATGSTNGTSSNTSVVAVSPINPNQLRASALASGTATVTWTWTSPSGTISEADTVNVTTDPPAAIAVTYGAPA